MKEFESILKMFMKEKQLKIWNFKTILLVLKLVSSQLISSRISKNSFFLCYSPCYVRPKRLKNSSILHEDRGCLGRLFSEFYGLNIEDKTNNFKMKLERIDDLGIFENKNCWRFIYGREKWNLLK